MESGELKRERFDLWSDCVIMAYCQRTTEFAFGCNDNYQNYIGHNVSHESISVMSHQKTTLLH